MIIAEDLETIHAETEDKLKASQQLSTGLQIQIANVKSETEKCQLEKQKLMQEKVEEQKVLRDALDKALRERTELETKFKRDFEQVRNVNCEREEQLMEDCEWKLRTMQKQCKEKLEAADKEKVAAVKKMTDIESEWSRHTTEVSELVLTFVHVTQLRCEPIFCSLFISFFCSIFLQLNECRYDVYKLAANVCQTSFALHFFLHSFPLKIKQ